LGDKISKIILADNQNATNRGRQTAISGKFTGPMFAAPLNFLQLKWRASFFQHPFYEEQ